MWQCVSEKLLAEGGYTASARHCQSKWNFLYKTYVNSQNQQGAFYAKIRQIVEYSQQVNSNAEVKSSDEATADVNEQIEELGHEPDSEVQVEVETLEENEPIDTIEYSSLKVENTPQTLEKLSEQSFEQDQQPSKRLKLEQGAPVRDEETQQVQSPDVPEPPQQSEQQQLNQSEPTAVDLSSVLQSIVSKIDAIHEEQLSQGRRLEWMERLQLENRQTLLEIKNHLKMK
uniref:Uncharacterized protein n=1 Tax=Culex tarsalis TaxID=7177 RepID=A0A1Q3EYH5_CULTA